MFNSKGGLYPYYSRLPNFTFIGNGGVRIRHMHKRCLRFVEYIYLVNRSYKNYLDCNWLARSRCTSMGVYVAVKYTDY